MEGVPLIYRVAGRGRPLVLLHGLAGSSRWWARNVRALAREHRLYLLDAPGFGRMRHVPRTFRRDLSGWTQKAVLALGLGDFDLMGHSMGAAIALRVAARMPDSVRKLVLVAPAVLMPSAWALAYFLPLLKATRYISPRLMPTLARDTLRSGPFVIWAAGKRLLRAALEHDIRLVKAPTLVVLGARDTIVPPSTARELSDRLQNVQTVTFVQGGHVPMFDCPEEFNLAVLNFLRDEN